MYENIGNKIKSLAVVICWILIIYFVILGFVQMGHHMFWSGLITIVGGALIAWVSTLTLYGFGELIDYIKDIKYSLGNTENELKKVSKNTTPPPKPMPTGWSMGKCELCDKTEVLVCDAKIVDEMGTRYRKVCKDCFNSNGKIFSADESGEQIKEDTVNN